ncbi:hypothetical protein [Methanocella arvoryzae]|uniref:Uncharacterized protein n=1 Tax=Methanocella arvoryzae (strain DSM 22066 / NBRC 105507 / MRE50) TaxID=351160 RepID=Q0W195_METAR|nr:hypothetical protein [Methanocella arvoryzae]CAJ37848.1 hypothetical protein RRC69 [Methanocella arvoryzae MRE50]
MGKAEHMRPVSGQGTETLAATVTRGTMIILIALGVAMGLFSLLALGSIKLMAGDYPPGFIMLLAAGFMLSLAAGWRFKRYQGHLAVLGISMLALAGVIWAIFEDGLMGKAFMLLLVVSAGSMAAIGFYNLFVRKSRPDMPG